MATIKDLLSAMIGKINKAPKTVNGVEPDENGNIEVVSGASSWNDLPDKPFGEETKMVPITWDGSFEDQHYVLMFSDNGECVIHSGLTPTPEELIGHTVKVLYNGEILEITLTDDMLRKDEWVEQGMLYNYSFVYRFNGADRNLITVVTKVDPDRAYREKGLYFFFEANGDIESGTYTEKSYTVELDYLVPQVEVTPIDTKYLPEHLQFGESYIPVDADIEYRGVRSTRDDGELAQCWDVYLHDGAFIDPSKTYAFEINGKIIGHSNGFGPYHTYGVVMATGNPYWIDFNENYNNLPFAFSSNNNEYNPDGTCAGREWELNVDITLFPEAENLKVRVLELEVKPVDAKYLPEHLQFGESLGTILDKTTVNISDNGNYIISTTLAMAPGWSYHVTWNNDQYTLEPIENNGMLFLGNIAMAGAPTNTGEPFCIVYMEQNGEKQLIILAQPGSTNIVSISGTVFKTIDPKYLPYGNAEEASF